MRVDHGGGAHGVGIAVGGTGTSVKGIAISVRRIVVHHGGVCSSHIEVDRSG